jgi:hypothetical protein
MEKFCLALEKKTGSGMDSYSSMFISPRLESTCVGPWNLQIENDIQYDIRK